MGMICFAPHISLSEISSMLLLKSLVPGLGGHFFYHRFNLKGVVRSNNVYKTGISEDQILNVCLPPSCALKPKDTA
jgi:hypothetical protein